MFVVSLKYLVPIEMVEKTRPEHVKFLDKFYGEKKFLVSGRKHDSSGGIIIVVSNSEDEVHQIMKQDPFFTQKIAEYEVIGFNPTKISSFFTQNL